MPVEAKPLFRPDVLREHLAAFKLPDRLAVGTVLRSKLAHWAELISSESADSLKEREILPDFLTDFFGGVLGYTSPATPPMALRRRRRNSSGRPRRHGCRYRAHLQSGDDHPRARFKHCTSGGALSGR